MLQQLKDPGHPDPAAVQALEHRIGKELPADYRDFLLKYDGAVPKPHFVAIPIHPDKAIPIQVLYGVKSEIKSERIEWEMDVMGPRIPDHLMPIGCSGMEDDLYCMDISAENYGKIYFWDSYRECGKDCLDNVFFVADSFTEFLELLTDEVAD